MSSVTAAATSADVLVIGAGLIGLSTAWSLRQRGMSVTVLEASVVGRHASSASAGGVRSLNRHPAEIPLVRAALPLWETLTNELGHPCGFQISGQIRVAANAEGMDALASRAAHTQTLGYDHERMIDRQALHRRLPQLASHCQGALLVEDDGFADPLATVHAYRQACEKAGVLIREGVRAVSISRDGVGLCVTVCPEGATPSDAVTFLCQNCVNACGAWGNTLSQGIGENVPVRKVALQMAVTQPLSPFVSAVVGCHARPLSLKQTGAGAVVIGGGFEGHVHHDEQAGWHTTLNTSRAAANLANAVALFPHLNEARVVRQWAGIEGMVDDGLPVLGPSLRLPGLVHAFGFSAHGFALVPIVGPLVADLIQGSPVTLPIGAFSVDRFTRQRRDEAA